VANRLSPHQIGVADLLDGAKWLGRMPEHLVLLGIVPQSMDLVVGVSACVRAALPMLVEQIIDASKELGFVFTPRHPAAPGSRSPDIARLVWMR
jgi:hydrogenase maturation protease